MEKMLKDPWDVSIYKNNEGDFVLELLDNSLKSKSKYWIHLEYITVVEHVSNYFNPVNGDNVNHDYKQGDTDLCSEFSSKYIPLDSYAYRMGTLTIPKSKIDDSISKCIRITDKPTTDLDKGKKGYKSVHVIFTFKDNGGRECSAKTEDVLFKKYNDSGVHLYFI